MKNKTINKLPIFWQSILTGTIFVNILAALVFLYLMIVAIILICLMPIFLLFNIYPCKLNRILDAFENLFDAIHYKV